MKKQLLIKLSVFIVTAMMFSASANAQIVYTDVIPDVTKSCTVLIGGGCSEMDSIDINNDGHFDLKLMLIVTKDRPIGGVVYANANVKAYPLNGSAIRTDSAGYPVYMNLNDVIDASGHVSITAGQILISRSDSTGNSPDSSGNWMTVADGFLGLKIISGSQTNYCWVRLSVAAVTSYATFTIKDFAYNTIPDQPILAGQTMTTGVIENAFASSITLFPNPVDNHFSIDLGINHKKVQVKIADITGKVVFTTIATDTQRVEVNTNDLPVGIYVVQIQAAGFITAKKLVIEK